MTDAPRNTAGRELTTSRVIDAPRESVFAAVRDPVRLARWWGPAGFSNTFEECDFRNGGVWRFVMHGPGGANYPNESVFAEVVDPERVVIEHFSGHHFVLTIEFVDQGSDTLVRWCQQFDTAAHCERIASVVRGANEQNLDRLSAEVLRGV